MLEKLILALLDNHRGKLIGITAGLVAAILFVSLGFLRALFVIVCLVLGYIIGKAVDEQKDVDAWMKRLFK
jgi:uncharacterized membrane protein